MDVNKLIHELQTYQVELEMQNDELRNVHLELEESRNRYIDLFDFAPIGYFILDETRIIKEVNLAGANFLDMQRHYLLQKEFSCFISVEDREIYHEYCKELFSSQARKMCELRLIKKNGEKFYAQLTGIVLQSDYNDCKQFYVAVVDITQHRQNEERIRQRELELAHFSRLNTMGEMVSGIAHELNQPLTAIVQYSGGCLTRLRNENVSLEIITIMERVIIQAERAGAIIHRLKNFLKKQDLQTEKIDINTLIRSTLDLLEHEIKKANINVTLELDDLLPAIQGDPIQLQQAILNIIHNAVEAMQASDAWPKTINIHTRQPSQENLEVNIADSGCGIPDDKRAQIFEPFFTTKIAGMGMGLTIARSIIEKHSGSIFVDSGLSIGTRFHILLPIN